MILNHTAHRSPNLAAAFGLKKPAPRKFLGARPVGESPERAVLHADLNYGEVVATRRGEEHPRVDR